ncbi:MAG: MOSC N-terminal beta barrel domain-containing protein [Ilumatobacteraceae bacterium]
MKIVGLYRYPVKSLQGESITTATVGDHGIIGDRSHALRDTATGVVLTARRDPVLLFATGVLRSDGHAEVQLPDGTRTTDAATLSAWIGRPVELVAPTDHPSRYELAIDPEDDSSAVRAWEGPAGSYHDSTRTQLSLIATGDIRRWDVRRFRPNVVVDSVTVDGLLGRRIRLGHDAAATDEANGCVELDVVKQIDRCAMVTRPQPGGIERDVEVLRTVRREREMMLGVGAMTLCTGTIELGHHLVLIEPDGAHLDPR